MDNNKQDHHMTGDTGTMNIVQLESTITNNEQLNPNNYSHVPSVIALKNYLMKQPHNREKQNTIEETTSKQIVETNVQEKKPISSVNTLPPLSPPSMKRKRSLKYQTWKLQWEKRWYLRQQMEWKMNNQSSDSDSDI